MRLTSFSQLRVGHTFRMPVRGVGGYTGPAVLRVSGLDLKYCVVRVTVVSPAVKRRPDAGPLSYGWCDLQTRGATLSLCPKEAL